MPLPDGNATGTLRYRVGLFGRLILQCEILHRGYDPDVAGAVLEWRDATKRDLRRIRAQRERMNKDGVFPAVTSDMQRD